MFDSGVGGLSIYRRLGDIRPREPVTYLADQSWAPYGERSLEEVRARALAISDNLIDRGAEVVVVACNSASAAALSELREVYPAITFVGMEPAVKPAAVLSGSGVVGVLATAATFQGELYASVVDRHAAGIRLIERAPADLALLVERGDMGRAQEALRRELAELKGDGVDTIVLGCTHYSLLAGEIRGIVGGGVTVVDPAPAVARRIGSVLDSLEPRRGGSPSAFLTTGDPNMFSERLRTLTGGEATPHHVTL